MSLSSPTDLITAHNKSIKIKGLRGRLTIEHGNGLELSTCLNMDRWLNLFAFFTGAIRLLYSHLQIASKCHFTSCTWETGVDFQKSNFISNILFRYELLKLLYLPLQLGKSQSYIVPKEEQCSKQSRIGAFYLNIMEPKLAPRGLL